MLKKTPVASEKPHASPATSPPILSATALTYETGGKTLLQSVDLSVSPGEILTIIGPNGAGKTTLLRLLLGLLRPSTGTIDKHPDLTIGYVPQKFNLDKTIPMTVARFFALKAATSEQQAIAALNQVGAKFPLERQIADLSGGEFQRVVLARAILHEPKLLILDEPAQGVDYSGEVELYQLIASIRDKLGCAIIMVSHDLHIVMAASDQVICLNQHVCCSGIPETVTADPEYLRLFGPEAAGTMAIYHHEHDHHHDITGTISNPPHHGSGDGCNHVQRDEKNTPKDKSQ